VLSKAPGGARWNDDALLAFIGERASEQTAVAVAAPLTVPACVRCRLDECTGVDACADPAIVWLRTVGQSMAAMEERDRVAAIPSGSGALPHSGTDTGKRPVAPYTQRCTEVLLHYTRELVPREHLRRGAGPIASRAVHLRRRLGALGYRMNRNLIEVSPRATVHALLGAELARGYKRDADPWETRAAIVERLGSDVEFSARSRLAREDVLRNDNCFDAVLAAYTAYLWARDAWVKPECEGEPFETDGWIWTPPGGE